MMKTISATLLCLLFTLFTATVSGQEVDSTAIKAIKRDLFQIDSLEKLRQYNAAITIALQSNEYAKSTIGKEHPLYIFNISALARMYEATRQYEKAEAFYLECKDVRLKTTGSESIEYAKMLNNLGTLYRSTNQFDKAEPLLLESLGIRERVSGRESTNYAIGAFNLANLYRSMDQYSKAEALYLEARAIRIKTTGTDDRDYAALLNNLASLYKLLSRFKDAEILYKESIDTRARTLGKGHADYAQSLNNMANLYRAWGFYKKAEPLLLESLAITEKTTGKETGEYAMSLNNLAILYKQTDQFQRAEALYLESAAIRKKLLGTQHPEYASSLFNLGNLYGMMGLYEKAIPLYLESKAIREKKLGKKNPDYAMTLNGLAGTYDNIGREDLAKPLHLEQLQITEEVFGKEDPNYAMALTNYANSFEDKNDYATAESMYAQSLAILERTLGNMHPDYAVIAFNQATLYQKIGQFKKAEALFLKIKDIWAEIREKTSPSYASAINNLATLYGDLGQFDKSEALLEECLALKEKIYGRNHPDYIGTLSNLGVLYLYTNRLSKAGEYLFQTQVMKDSVYGSNHLECAGSLLNLAVYHKLIGEYDKAVQYCLKSEKIIETETGAQNADYMTTQFVHAQALCAASRQAEAIPILKQAMSQAQFHLLQGAQYMTENTLFNYLQLFNNNLDETFSDALKSPVLTSALATDMFNISLFKKGFLLEQANQFNHLNTIDTTTIMLARLLISCRQKLSTLYLKPLNEREYLPFFEERADSLEKEIVRRVAGIRETHRQVNCLEVQKKLAPDAAAMEFVYFRNWVNNLHTDSVFYAAILLRPGWEQPRVIYLCEEKQLDALMQAPDATAAVARLYTTRNITPTKTTNLSGLYPLIWQPLDSLLQGVNTIYYSPSGLLHRVAFNAIPTGKPAEVLADRYRLYQLGSTRSLVTDSDRTGTATPAAALLVGGIRYDKPKAVTPSQADSLALQQLSTTAIAEARRSAPQTRGEGFQYLPGTKKEVTQLEKLFAANNIPSTTFTDTSATEEQIKLLGTPGHPAPTVLHLATHGFFFPDPATKPQTTDGESHFSLLEHPLLRSGLALAGANQAWKNGQPLPGREDGILTAYEISNLNLTGTQLAVLSACETGLGDIQGSEGVYGLQRAFKIAGVERLIVTLWDVPDKETAAFMSLFYEKWLSGGKDIRAAFYETQTAMRQRYKDPFVWAAFVLVE